MQFPIAIHKDDNSVYGVIVPDIAGCYSWGNTLDEAIGNAKEAIYSHVTTLLEYGEAVDLTASKIDSLRAREEFTDAIWAIVEIDMSKLDATPERVNISLPHFLLHTIDQYVKAHHETRSGFLARAAMRALACS